MSLPKSLSSLALAACCRVIQESNDVDWIEKYYKACQDSVTDEQLFSISAERFFALIRLSRLDVLGENRKDAVIENVHKFIFFRNVAPNIARTIGRTLDAFKPAGNPNCNGLWVLSYCRMPLERITDIDHLYLMFTQITQSGVRFSPRDIAYLREFFGHRVHDVLVNSQSLEDADHIMDVVQSSGHVKPVTVCMFPLIRYQRIIEKGVFTLEEIKGICDSLEAFEGPGDLPPAEWRECQDLHDLLSDRAFDLWQMML